ncbi:MAG: hypothetical protein RLZZ175_85 [Bacteroidota bacterium]|jgi:hypothetical protein
MKTKIISDLKTVKIKPETVKKSNEKPKVILGAGRKYTEYYSESIFNDDLLN